MELLSTKTELTALKPILTTAVAQIKQLVESVMATNCTPTSNDMDTDVDHLMETNTQHQTPLDLPALLNKLKHDIATIILEMQTMFQQQS